MYGVLIQIILSLLAGIFIGIILSVFGAPRLAYAAGTILVILLVLIGTIWFANRPTPSIDLKILAPSDGSECENKTIVQGKVSPSQSVVYVLVHPLSTNIWWVQNLPLVQNDGHWQTQVYLGEENVGIKESYEIIAVATNENYLMRLIRGSYLSLGQLGAIPPYFAKSNLIVVKRIR